MPNFIGLWNQATLGQDGTWKGDHLGTQGADGMGLDIDALFEAGL